MALQQAVEETVRGLGYELVEVVRSAGGTLRVTIDWPWKAGDAERFVTTDDCEKVTRQLQYALEVDGVEYRRLEVSSPGTDRPLRGEQDFERFAGQVVDVVLKAPVGAAAAEGMAVNRKRFRGTLEKAQGGWRVVWSDAPPPKPGQRVSRKRPPPPLQAMDFSLDELKEARLASVVDFKRAVT